MLSETETMIETERLNKLVDTAKAYERLRANNDFKLIMACVNEFANMSVDMLAYSGNEAEKEMYFKHIEAVSMFRFILENIIKDGERAYSDLQEIHNKGTA